MKFVKGKCIKPIGCNKCCIEFHIRVPDLRGDDLFRLKNLLTREIKVRKEKGYHRVMFKIPCKFLKTRRCSIYTRRPRLCQNYPFNEEEFNEFCMSD